MARQNVFCFSLIFASCVLLLPDLSFAQDSGDGKLNQLYFKTRRAFGKFDRESRRKDRESEGQKARTEKNQRKTGQILRPLWEALRSHPQSKIKPDALAWISFRCMGHDYARRALQLLLDQHHNHRGLRRIAQRLGRAPAANREWALKACRLILEKSKNPVLKIDAEISTAEIMLSASDPQTRAAGKVILEKLLATKQAQIPWRAQRLLDRIDRPQVGQMAPEIIGVDLDGSEFKLSDYRGKIVLLDFWGTW